MTYDNQHVVSPETIADEYQKQSPDCMVADCPHSSTCKLFALCLMRRHHRDKFGIVVAYPVKWTGDQVADAIPRPVFTKATRNRRRIKGNAV